MVEEDISEVGKKVNVLLTEVNGEEATWAKGCHLPISEVGAHYDDRN